MVRYRLSAAFGCACVIALALALSACTAVTARQPELASRVAPRATTSAAASPGQAGHTGAGHTAIVHTRVVHTGFVGYRWTVTAISDGGPYVAVSARDAVYLAFYRDGLFAANEPANTHSGPYRVTSDGFEVGQVASTLALAGWGDQATGLAVAAMMAFSEHPGTRAVVVVTGKRMTVYENGFTLVCTRAAEATAPAPRSHR
jgi:hypothetical protein